MSKASIWREQLPTWGSVRMSLAPQTIPAIRILHAHTCIHGLFPKKCSFQQHRRGPSIFVPMRSSLNITAFLSLRCFTSRWRRPIRLEETTP